LSEQRPQFSNGVFQLSSETLPQLCQLRHDYSGNLFYEKTFIKNKNVSFIYDILAQAILCL
jgi:hypothetical protein